MSFNEFKGAMHLLVEGLPGYGVEDRLSVYYEFFKQETEYTIAQAARRAVSELDKFPSIHILKGYVSQVKALSPIKQEARACNLCDSLGLRIAIRIKDNSSFAFRCSCENGVPFQKIPKWGLRSDFVLLKDFGKEEDSNVDSHSEAFSAEVPF